MARRKRYNSNTLKLRRRKMLSTAIVVVAAFLAGIGLITAAFNSGGSRDVTEPSGNTTQETTTFEYLTTHAETPTTASKTTEAETETKPENTKKIAYLTFDDGPSANTPKILKVLKEKKAVATFFVIRSDHTEYYDDIINAGCAIGLHTYSHDYSKIYSSEKSYFEDLKKISDYVEKYAHVKSMIVRLPGGSSNTVSKKYSPGIITAVTGSLLDKGYSYFDWNVDSGDAAGNHVAKAKLISNVKEGTMGMKTINILMHDAVTKDTTVQALPDIIDYLRDEGYTFEVLTTDSKPIRHKVLN